MEFTVNAQREGGYRHDVTARSHELAVDEPRDRGGEDSAPTPQELLAASLASCTAVTIEMYAKRKGWELGAVAVSCRYTTAERGSPSRFELEVEIPETLDEEQLRKIEVIAAKCPVHRALEGEVEFVERVHAAAPASTA